VAAGLIAVILQRPVLVDPDLPPIAAGKSGGTIAPLEKQLLTSNTSPLGVSSSEFQTKMKDTRDYKPAPCAGCLDERAALDVASTILNYARAIYPEFQPDIQAEIYADIPWLKTDPLRRLAPPLPAGLEGAPAHFSIGPHLPAMTEEERKKSWVIWFQYGWLHPGKLEELIASGKLPPVARSWPPLEQMLYIIIDATNGAWLDSYGWTGTRLDDLTHWQLHRAARERARYWLGEEGPKLERR